MTSTPPNPNHGFLSRLPEALVSQIVKGGQRVAYAAGSTIPVGDELPWMAIVSTGCLRAYLASPEGGQVTLRYLSQGDLIGSLQPAHTARAIQSVQASELLHLDPTRFLSLAQKEPALSWELAQELARIVGVNYRATAIRTFGSIQMRVASAIYERAMACGGLQKGTVVHGTQQELATAAGTVREVVAPALHAMRNEGIIDIRRGAVVILDPDRLAGEADA